MTPARYNVAFAFFPYGGNGGTSSETPDIRRWWTRTMVAIKTDPYLIERIGDVYDFDISDTPITMSRNKAVVDARKIGADFLVMCDSDMAPDNRLNAWGAKPFFESSFRFCVEQRERGRHAVVAAPYCGPPPIENVYVFRWARSQSDHPNPDHAHKPFEREEAAQRSGLERCSALPTGLCIFDLAVFDHLKPPYFYYEYTDQFESEKASTEDVTATRDIGLIFQEKFGYCPIWVNWDAWAGHWKPKCVGKPEIITADRINDGYRRAIEQNRKSNESLTFQRNTIPPELMRCGDADVVMVNDEDKRRCAVREVKDFRA